LEFVGGQLACERCHAQTDDEQWASSHAFFVSRRKEDNTGRFRRFAARMVELVRLGTCKGGNADPVCGHGHHTKASWAAGRRLVASLSVDTRNRLLVASAVRWPRRCHLPHYRLAFSSRYQATSWAALSCQSRRLCSQMSGHSSILHEVYRSATTSSLPVMGAVLEADAIGTFDPPCSLVVRSLE
jgi:hypothetical protein